MLTYVEILSIKADQFGLDKLDVFSWDDQFREQCYGINVDVDGLLILHFSLEETFYHSYFPNEKMISAVVGRGNGTEYIADYTYSDTNYLISSL